MFDHLTDAELADTIWRLRLAYWMLIFAGVIAGLSLAGGIIGAIYATCTASRKPAPVIDSVYGMTRGEVNRMQQGTE